MKIRNLLFALIIFSTYSARSQTQLQVEEPLKLKKSLFDIQTGLIGAWIAYEHKIAPQVALRYDIGVSTDLWMGDFKGFGYSTYSQISVETRFYHHQINHKNKDVNISGNSGNFLSIKLLYSPSSVIINSRDISVGTYPRSYVSIMPRYGIRRMITEHFHYELAFGFGYGYITHEPVDNQSKHFLDYNVHIRIGYTF